MDLDFVPSSLDFLQLGLGIPSSRFGIPSARLGIRSGRAGGPTPAPPFGPGGSDSLPDGERAPAIVRLGKGVAIDFAVRSQRHFAQGNKQGWDHVIREFPF